MTALVAVRGGFDAVRWFIGGVLGEDAYAKYLAHVAASHETATPMTEREFWRDHTDRQDANPQGRCC
jgi:uncharacterized short protein YbdD (DUF466 family)